MLTPVLRPKHVTGRVKLGKGGHMTKKKQLTARQKATLKRHAAHHSDRHIAMMIKEMRDGKSFTMAHKKAQKKVGT